MQPINIDFQTVQNILASKIANLEVQLATEQAARQALVKYIDELEKKLEKYEQTQNAK